MSVQDGNIGTVQKTGIWPLILSQPNSMKVAMWVKIMDVVNSASLVMNT